jgi:NTP pyrophosphatase (non-canonical NTP hydrolase)
MTRIYTDKSREYSRNYYKNNKDYFKLYWREKNLLKKIGEDLEAIRNQKKLEKLDKKLMKKNCEGLKKTSGTFLVNFD